MAHRVCPWWLGYFLLSPLLRRGQNPAAILAPCVREGMTVLEPGPGMGFFTLELARRAGASGRVVAVDIQLKMLEKLGRRLEKAGLLDRVTLHLAKSDSLLLSGLEGTMDFALAFAVVHEMPSASRFFAEISRCLKPGALLLLAEPAGHVKPAEFNAELEAASQAGLALAERPQIRHSHAALLKKSA